MKTFVKYMKNTCFDIFENNGFFSSVAHNLSKFLTFSNG